MKKSECTPEQWDAYRAYQREYYRKNGSKVRAQHRAQYLRRIDKERDRYLRYNASDHGKLVRRKNDARPEKVAKRRAYAQTPDAKRRARDRMIERLEENPMLQVTRNNYGRLLRTGFTPELFEALLVTQGSACAICRRPFSIQNRAHADHCHVTNTPRGLLCFQCNIIDGKLLSIGINPVDFGKSLHDYRKNFPSKIINLLAILS